MSDVEASSLDGREAGAAGPADRLLSDAARLAATSPRRPTPRLGLLRPPPRPRVEPAGRIDVRA